MSGLFRALIAQLSPLPYPTSDCTGKTVIVTGANTGLGLEAARHFVRLNAKKVILGCRDVGRGNAAKANIEASAERDGPVIEVWPLDLECFDSLEEFCERANKLEQLHIVVQNAGIQTTDKRLVHGFESQIMVNVISTFLMALMLLPALQRSGTPENPSHMSIVGSNAHKFATVNAEREQSILRSCPGMSLQYAYSKLLILLAARELAESLGDTNGQHAVVLNVMEPGLCRSDLFRNARFPVSWMMAVALPLLGRTSEIGSRCLVHASTAGQESHGRYLEDCGFGHEAGFVSTDKGRMAQEKVFKELLAIAESRSLGDLGTIDKANVI
ncbi:hypothetical protein B0I35DRAFT_439841 [Stachybotrys elegans]|uniref:Uncharacterized protein n=1 Tax=Stachybotrys elegans TaxID=80388 RepID=A0A8K0SID5_9HYPO|nr:hypothetical protein B0I35DRAFT_439841 [Stachybotrys elegans]